MSVARVAAEYRALAKALPAAFFWRYVWASARHVPAILRSGRLTSVDAAMRGVVAFRVPGATLTLDCGAMDAALTFDSSHAFTLCRELFCRDVYFRAFATFVAGEGMVVDFGGNRGIFSYLAGARLRPLRSVYVEPERRYRPVFECLAARLPDVRFETHCGFVGRLPARVADAVLLAPKTLIRGRPVALLKADIEGAEEALFADSAGWLDGVERVAMESHPGWCDLETLVSGLRHSGFFVVPCDALGRVVPASQAAYIYAARRSEWLAPRYRAASQAPSQRHDGP